jgi:hypothetical protein
MLTPRDRIPILWSLHRTVSTSDVPVVILRHTRVGYPFMPPDVLIIRALGFLADPCECVDVDLRIEGPLLRPAGES